MSAKIFLKKARVLFLLVIGFCLPVFAQEAPDYAEDIPNGFSVWITNWDNESLDVGYSLMKWEYDADNRWWDLTQQFLEDPLILGEDYNGNIYDMAIDLFYLEGETTPRALLAVSMGDGHFPSTGTEFQHRVLNDEGNWESAQDPVFTTPANISPLGLDIYWAGDQLRVAWLEDSDDTSVGTYYDQELSIGTDGTLSLVGEATMIYQQNLDWSGSFPGDGGLNGISAVDFDGDGDRDFLIAQIFYGDDSAGIFLLEQTSPGVYADSLQEVVIRETGGGSEGLTTADIDGDENVDVLVTNHPDGAWDEVYWLEKSESGLEEVGLLLDGSSEGDAYQLNISHIFGVYANEPPSIGGTVVESWSIY